MMQNNQQTNQSVNVAFFWSQRSNKRRIAIMTLSLFFTDSLMIMLDLNSIPKFDQTTAALSFQEMKTPLLMSLPNSLATTHQQSNSGSIFVSQYCKIQRPYGVKLQSQIFRLTLNVSP